MRADHDEPLHGRCRRVGGWQRDHQRHAGGQCVVEVDQRGSAHAARSVDPPSLRREDLHEALPRVAQSPSGDAGETFAEVRVGPADQRGDVVRARDEPVVDRVGQVLALSQVDEQPGPREHEHHRQGEGGGHPDPNREAAHPGSRRRR